MILEFKSVFLCRVFELLLLEYNFVFIGLYNNFSSFFLYIIF